MQDASPRTAALSRGKRGTILISGTLITILAAGIGMQVWRAQISKAAEQTPDANAGRAIVSASDKPVGRVNGQPISYDELAQECILRHGTEVLQNIVNRTLIQQACSESGITISDAEVNQEIVRISKKFGLPVDQWEKMLQAERGLSPIQYRRDVIWPMLALRKLAGQEVKVTREMLEEAYEDNYGPRVKARMLVLDNMRRAQDIWEKVRQTPEEFENYARDYSVEPNSRALGGTVPPIRRHSGAHEEIRKAAFKLKSPDEISGIIQVGVNQYVILKYEGMTEPIEHDPKDVEVALHEELREREVQAMVAETFKKINEGARVDNYLTGESKGPIDRTAGASLPNIGLEQALQRR
ncbi:MAG: SurA N-terminal domain-containing protein [Planctomycetaceae bacterium]